MCLGGGVEGVENVNVNMISLMVSCFRFSFCCVICVAQLDNRRFGIKQRLCREMYTAVFSWENITEININTRTRRMVRFMVSQR